MKKIYKYTLKLDTTQTVAMPKGAQILTVQTQNNERVIWALVDPAAPLWPRDIVTIGTGWDIPDRPELRYISTVQDGPYVWHFFERNPQ